MMDDHHKAQIKGNLFNWDDQEIQNPKEGDVLVVQNSGGSNLEKSVAQYFIDGK